MKTKTLNHLSGAWFYLALIGLWLGGIGTAPAFTTLDREACWSAYTNAFYYTTTNNGIIYGYFRDKEGGTAVQFNLWQDCERLEMVEDAAAVGLASTNMVNALCAGITNLEGINWRSWDPFNDDMFWGSLAFNRAYELTGNTNYLAQAKYAFDIGYSGGFDPSNGGIFQTTTSSNECTCGVGNACDAAYRLYKNLNDTSYLTKATNLFGYMITNLFSPTIGGVLADPVSGGYFPYDQGTFITAAIWLGYTNDAYLTCNFVTNNWSVTMASFGQDSPGGAMNGICLRGMARAAHDTASSQASCDVAWSWRNSRNLTTCDWTHRWPDTNVMYSFDALSGLVGMLCMPASVPPTLPVTAADVMGSQVTFTTAGFGGTNLAYQWQVLKAGVTNNIPGATGATLTIFNLQLTNTGSYQLQASNASGISVSTASSLTVSNVPAPVNNVVISCAAQTGLGDGFALTPTWSLTPGSVIAGQSPGSTNGDFNLENNYGNRDVNSLTTGGDLTITPGGGSSTTTSSNYVICGNGTGPDGTNVESAGSLVIYTLLSGSGNGFNLTNITVYGGWKDNTRGQQAYNIYYATVSAPTNFILLGSVNYTPVNNGYNPQHPTTPGYTRTATRVTLAAATSMLATNVAAVKFDFTNPASQNGYVGYSQIAVFATGVPSAPTGLTAAAGNGQAGLTWNSSSGATSYNVKRSTISQSEVTITNVSGTNYIDAGLANGTVYYYKVSALNAGGESVHNSSEVSATPAPVTIALHDGPVGMTNTLGSTSISKSFTATTGARVLVVVLLNKSSSSTGVAPSTLSWNGQTLTRAVTTVDSGSIYRDASVYYVFNPVAATANITGTLTATPVVTYLEAYTLSGVNTSAVPLVGSANSISGTNLTFTVAGVPTNSWAAAGGVLGAYGVAGVAITGTGGMANVFYGNDTSADNCAFAFGYLSGLSAGSDTIAYSWNLSGRTPTANAFAAAIFGPGTFPGAVIIGAASSPQITSVSLNGATLSISATNGTAGGNWSLLQSADLTLPLSQWETNCAGNFDGDGNLSTNIVNTATNNQQFYILKVQ